MEWKNAKSFNDALNLMVKFLKGEIGETPWHFGEPDKETENILHKLISINQKGFMTIEGQPGTCSELTAIKTGEKYTEIQRGYVSGFISNDNVKKLLKGLKDTDKFFYYIERLDSINYNYDEKEIETQKGKQFIPLTIEKGKSFHNYYTKFWIPKTDGQASLNIVMDNIPLYNDMKKNTSYVFIIKKKVCETDLEDILENILKTI
jgi:hypothetical protein